MAIDQYALCPCGNGKKIKFCKCHENLAEIQKLDRMIQGDQMVAALDHINQLIKVLPSEPWLLAMKCEVLLKLNELESLEETSAKFIRLQPDNPLPKLYRSLVACVRGNAEESCSLLLQGLAATTGPLHHLFPTTLYNLIQLLIQSRRFLTALMHADLMMALSEGNDEAEQLALEMYTTLSSDDRVNLLQRELPPSPPVVSDQPYAERYREAIALLEKHHVGACRTKLDGMIREFGQEYPLLVAKLHCQLIHADLDGAAETCLKLASSPHVSEPQQIYFQALAFEIAPTKSGVGVELELASYILTDELEMEGKLLSSSRLVSVKSDAVRDMIQALSGEEVPPKAMYILTYPVLGEEFAEYRPRASGQWVGLMGKQTDKPATLLILEPTRGFPADRLRELKEELGTDALKRDVITKLPMSVIGLFNSTIQVEKRPPAEVQEKFSHALRELDYENFKNFPVPILNGGTPKSVSGGSQYRRELQALILWWQAGGSTKLEAADFKALQAELNLPSIKLTPESDNFDLVGAGYYFWADYDNIDQDSLLQLAQSALSRNAAVAMRPLAEKIASMQWSEEKFISADYTRLSLESRIATDPDKAEKLLFQLIEKGKLLNIVIGNLVLERCQILHSLGRDREAGDYFVKTFRERPDDPVMLQYYQMMLVESQRARGGGVGDGLSSALAERSLVGAGAQATPASSSKLWTPDQPNPTPAPPASGGGGGSGLWIPGQ